MKEFFLKLALAFIAMLAPIHAVIVTVFVLVLADLATGIWASTKEGQKISSAKLRDTVTKLLIYQTVIITGFLVETYLISGVIPVVKLAGAVIGMVELKSLIENADRILGRSLFKDLIEKLGSKNKSDKAE